MSKLIRIALVLAGLAVVPVKASELGLLLDKQFGSNQTYSDQNHNSQTIDGVKPSGFGIRGSYTVLDLKVAELGIAATYHPETKSDIIWGGTNDGTYKDEYLAIGAQVDWKFLVNLHAGLDIRREKLTTESSSGFSGGSTTYTRPWLKAGVGFSIPTPAVSPFVRLEVAVPTTKQGALSSGSSDDDARRAMAPSFQIGIYGGIRF